MPDRAPTQPGGGAGAGLDAEDAKLVTLARATRARVGAAEGAALRDETGRTYVGATVDLTSLRLTALEVAVGAAVASGATSVAAAAVVSGSPGPDRRDLGAVRELAGTGARVHIAGPDGTVVHTLSAG